MSGNVQVPPDGNPIIILVEQTMGGYSKIATVISSDLDRVGQAMPGDKIRFTQVSLERAHSIFRQRQRWLKEIKTLLVK